MKAIIYFLIITIIYSSLAICEETKNKYSNVKIDDLFIESEEKDEKIKNTTYETPDFNHLNEEDLELESLEISDIDITTFGEYEDFLNKYYDENFLDINSKFINQLGFEISTSSGIRIPVGSNAKVAFNSGFDFGLSIAPQSTFKLFNYNSKYFGNFNITQINPINKNYDKYQIIRFTGGIISYINKHIFISSGLSIHSSKSGRLGTPYSSLGTSINFDLGYKFNIIRQINIGLYLRGQSMISGTLDPPINGGGTLETISMGLILDSPIFLKY